MTKEDVIDFLKSKKELYFKMDESDRKDYVMECLDTAINLLSNTTDGDLISRNDVTNMFNTMDRYRADKLILQDTDREFPSNEVFIVDDCYELLEQLPTYSAEQTDSVLEQIKKEISHIAKPETDEEDYENGVYDGINLAIRTIDKYAGELEQTAEWEYNSFSDKWRCTKCFQSNNEKSKYCPNCGAKMKGDKE